MSTLQAILVTLTLLAFATRAQSLLLRGTTALWKRADDELHSPLYCSADQTLDVLMLGDAASASCIPARLDHAARRLPRQRLPAAFCLLESATHAGIADFLARLGFPGGDVCD